MPRVGQSRVLLVNEPGHYGKQEARGESAHQDARHALYRAHRSPHLFEKEVT